MEKAYKFYGRKTASVKDARGLTPRDYCDLLSGLWCAERDLLLREKLLKRRGEGRPV